MSVSVRIDLFNLDGQRIARLDRHEGLRIRARFGAERADAFVDLGGTDAWIPLEKGFPVHIEMDGRICFRGTIVRLRTDSAGALLGFDARRQPRRDLTEAVSEIFENMTVTEVLSELVSGLTLSPIGYIPDFPCSITIDRLVFFNTGLFFAVDILAKLAGNWIWDVTWDEMLRFRPSNLSPDSVIYYEPHRHRFTIHETAYPVRNYFRFHGGIANENEFRREFGDEESIRRYGLRRHSLFVRPIVTEQPYRLMKWAVLEELPHGGSERYLEFREGFSMAEPGDLVEVRETGMPQVDEDNVFRVKEVEHRVSPSGLLRTRLHLAYGMESSTRYQFYIDHDPQEDPSLFVDRRVGPFRLDFSVLDSAAWVG